MDKKEFIKQTFLKTLDFRGEFGIVEYWTSVGVYFITNLLVIISQIISLFLFSRIFSDLTSWLFLMIIHLIAFIDILGVLYIDLSRLIRRMRNIGFNKSFIFLSIPVVIAILFCFACYFVDNLKQYVGYSFADKLITTFGFLFFCIILTVSILSFFPSKRILGEKQKD